MQIQIEELGVPDPICTEPIADSWVVKGESLFTNTEKGQLTYVGLSEPIDTPTDEEKLRDAVAFTTGIRPRDGLDEVVDNLLYSDKFTISLNKGK